MRILIVYLLFISTPDFLPARYQKTEIQYKQKSYGYRGPAFGRPISFAQPKKKRPPPEETLVALMRLENTWWAWLSKGFNITLTPYWRRAMGTPTNRNFNPFQDVIGTHYEPYIGRFTYLNNQYEVELVKLQIDQELRDRKKIKEVAHQFTSLFIG